MSLIIDINPVPWKILDLVRARILRNRAKKAKKGMDWSKETLKREMSLQPGPLSRRKRDEPSFIPSPTATFVIEGSMRRIDYPFGTEEPYNLVAPYLYQETWNVYRQNTDDGTRTYFAGIGFLFPYNVTGSTFYFSNFAYKNPRDYKSRFYVSFFLTDGDEFIAVTTGIETGTADVSSSGFDGPFQTWKRGNAILQSRTPVSYDVLINDLSNPLHAWQAKQIPPLKATVNNNPPWNDAQVPCPVNPEFDEARISTIPGYIKTLAFDFTGYPQISGVLQTQEVTVEL